MGSRFLVKTNSENVIQYDGIHDSEIISLSLNKESKGLEIGSRKVSGNTFKVHLSGIRRIACDDFKTQNVVFRMLAISKINVTDEIQSSPLGRELNSKDFITLISAIEKGDLTLFLVDASVGCEITCICEKVEIEH